MVNVTIKSFSSFGRCIFDKSYVNSEKMVQDLPEQKICFVYKAKHCDFQHTSIYDCKFLIAKLKMSNHERKRRL